MKSALIALVALVCLAIASPAHAWNCSNPLASRVDVGSTKPAGATAGDGDGQYYIGSDAANPNDYYVCEVPKTPPPTTPTTSNSSSSASAASTASSTASSNQNQKQTQGQTQTATGGAANATGGSVGNVSSTSKVSDSGNSSNKNTVSATGGNQTQTASANGNGVGNGNNSNDTTINEPREVASAYAPSVIPTAPCSKGYSGGGQGLLAGGALGFSRIDQNCAALEASRLAPSILARCKVFITVKYAKKAGVTLDDCLPKPVIVVAAPVAVVAPAPIQPSITINVPPAIVTVIPSPVVAPAPSVAVAAAATHHKTHIPCNPVPQGKGKCVVDNQSIRQ